MKAHYKIKSRNISDYQLALEQLEQEKRFNGELLEENRKLKEKNIKLDKELKEYQFLLYVKIERLGRKNGR